MLPKFIFLSFLRREKLQERKRQKKMRQKESKDKERKGGKVSSGLQDNFDASVSPRQSSPSSSSFSGTDANLAETLEEKHANEDINYDSSIGTHIEGLYRCDPVELPELDSQNNAYEHRTDSRKVTVQGGGWMWKDRKGEATFFLNHSKQNYGNEKRYYDHQQGGQKLIRKAYNHFGNFPHESSHSNVTPRYSHYREQHSGIKKSMTTSGSGHAVWTRKVSQSSVQNDVNMGSELRGVANDSPETNFSLHLEHLGMNNNLISVDSEKVGTESQESSNSIDSIASNSSGSISARVADEDQENSEELAGDHLKAITGEEGNGALVIGSVMIPFQNTWLNDSTLAGCVAESEINCWSRVDAAQEVDTHDNPVDEVMAFNDPCTSRREDTAKMIQWQNANKLGSVRVWQPVTPGEQNDMSNTGDLGRASDEEHEMHEPKPGISSFQRNDLDCCVPQHTVDEEVNGTNSSSAVNQSDAPPAGGIFCYSDIVSLLAQREYCIS
jgi:hypothetical protein